LKKASNVRVGLMPLKKLAMREVRLTYKAFESLVFPRLLAGAPQRRQDIVSAVAKVDSGASRASWWTVKLSTLEARVEYQ
jgi:hypothetical protein